MAKKWDSKDWANNIVSTGFKGDWPCVRAGSVPKTAPAKAAAAVPHRKAASTALSQPSLWEEAEAE